MANPATTVIPVIMAPNVRRPWVSRRPDHREIDGARRPEGKESDDGEPAGAKVVVVRAPALRLIEQKGERRGQTGQRCRNV